MAPHAASVLERGAADERSHGSGTGEAAWKRHGASGQELSPCGAPALIMEFYQDQTALRYSPRSAGKGASRFARVKNQSI